MLAVFLPGAALAATVAYVLPDIYEASTTIVVERKEMASIYSGAALVPRIEERLRVAQTFLTSDTLIQRVALRLGLADDPRDAVSIEDAVDSIRGKLQVKVSGLDSFQLS